MHLKIPYHLVGKDYGIIQDEDELMQRKTPKWKLELALKALEYGLQILDKLDKSYFENEGLVCWWNDWRARDARAHIEKTFDNGRFSRIRK